MNQTLSILQMVNDPQANTKQQALKLLASSIVFLLIVAAAGLAFALPTVKFDVATIVSARDVTPPEFGEAHPMEKLVQAEIQVSSLVEQGGDSDLVQYLYFLESPQQTFQVVDYLPRTTLSTDVVGKMGVEKNHDRSDSAGGNLTVGYETYASGNLSAGTTKSTSSKTKFEQLPPLELLAASGTVRRGTGVYFKLKPSTRSSLEGSKEFVLVMRVPRDWRGDVINVRCEALGQRNGVSKTFEGSSGVSGRAEFLVAMHLEGDMSARDSAGRLVEADAALRQAAWSYRKQIEDRAYGSPVHQFGVMISASKRRIPEDWLSQVVRQPLGAMPLEFNRYLPTQVQQASRKYADARVSLSKLSGHGAASVASVRGD